MIFHRIPLALIIAFGLVAPLSSATAFDRVLPQARIKDNGDVRLSDDIKIGRYQGGKFVSQPDAIQLQGSGSTGQVDGMNVLGRSLAARAREVINVLDAPYNAKCDYNTDDTAAFQAVAAAAANGRVRIELPAGGACIIKPNTFKLTGNLTELYGKGGGASIIIRGGDGDGVTFSPPDPTIQTAYLNQISNVRILRDANSNSGSGLHLVRQITFRSQRSESREFVQSVLIEGGTGFYFDHFLCQAGLMWPQNTLKPGSALMRIRPYVGGSVVETTTSVYLTQPEFSGNQQTTAQLEFAIDIGAVDTFNMTGGHIGFAQVDLQLLPSRSNVGIQNVSLSSGAYLDGSGFGGIGLSVPAIPSGQTGNYVIGVQAVGAIFQNHVGAADVSIKNPAAHVKLVANEFRNARFWGVYAKAAGKVDVVGNTFANMSTQGGAAISILSAPFGIITGNTITGVNKCVTSLSSVILGPNNYGVECSADSRPPAKAPAATVGTLPTCNGLTADSEMVVTDASNPAYRQTVASGGQGRVKVRCDTVSWVVN